PRRPGHGQRPPPERERPEIPGRSRQPPRPPIPLLLLGPAGETRGGRGGRGRGPPPRATTRGSVARGDFWERVRPPDPPGARPAPAGPRLVRRGRRRFRRGQVGRGLGGPVRALPAGPAAGTLQGLE